MRAEPRVAAHRHVPHEPPLGAERHAARRALHERRARGARASATTRCCSATPTRHPIRACSRPTIRGCAPTKACSRASAPCSTCPSTSSRGARGCATQGYDVPDDVREMYEPISDAPGAPVAYAAEHTEAAFLTGELLRYVDEQQGAPWFVHAAYIRPHPPFVAPAPYHAMYDPDTRAARRCATPTFEEEGAAHPLLAGAVLHPRSARSRRRGRAPAAARDLLRDDDRGRRAGRSAGRRAARARRVGRHARRPHVGPRRAARRPLAHREARLVRPELPRAADRARPASRVGRDARAASSRTGSPRTST